jgi:hypothetical protein
MVRMVSATPFLPGALCRFRHSPEPSRSRYQPAASSLPSAGNQTLRVISSNTLGQCVTACGHVSAGAGAGYEPEGIPVQFSVTFAVNSDGSISLGGSVGIVTEVGVFSLEAHVETTMQPSEDETLLVVRHHVKGGTADTVYRIGSGAEAVVHLNGSTTLYVTNHKVLIDATRASETITVMNAPAPPTSSQTADRADVRQPGPVRSSRRGRLVAGQQAHRLR